MSTESEDCQKHAPHVRPMCVTLGLQLFADDLEHLFGVERATPAVSQPKRVQKANTGSLNCKLFSNDFEGCPFVILALSLS